MCDGEDGVDVSAMLRSRRSQGDGGGVPALVSDGQVTTEVRTFQTTTADLLRLSKWLAENEWQACGHENWRLLEAGLAYLG